MSLALARELKNGMNIFTKMQVSPALPAHELAVIESVAAFARNELAPRAAEVDRSGEFPWQNVAAINARGLNTMFVPESYGGTALSYRCYLACVQEISSACASTGIIWATNFHAMKPVIEYGTEEQKARVLPRLAEGALAALVITEPSAGSDATAMRTSFREDGGEIVVNGSKSFITNGDVADFYLVFGKWDGEADARKAISCLLVERSHAGPNVIRLEEKMGHRGSSTAQLSFDGVRVPRSSLLAGPGEGLQMLLSSLNKSRPSVAAHALGIAHAAFDDAVAYINERRQSGKRIIEFQGIQFLLADLAADLALCDNWLNYVAAGIENGVDMSIEASILKMRASDLAMRVSTEAVQLLGGYGYCTDYRVERLMRDAKITQIWEGTNQIHRQLIGRSFLKR